MYLTVKDADFTCPECGKVVTETVVTHVQCVFTAAALGLHLGTGHTSVLVGEARWVVRCGESKALRPVRMQVGTDKALRDAGGLLRMGGHPVLTPDSAPASAHVSRGRSPGSAGAKRP